MAGGSGALLLLLPDLLARPRNHRLRAAARDCRDQPPARPHRPGRLAPGALALVRLVADRGPARNRYGDRRVVGLAVRPAGGVRGGGASRDRLSIDDRLPRSSRGCAILLPVRGRPAGPAMTQLRLLRGPRPLPWPQR